MTTPRFARDSAALLVIDVQERLCAAMDEAALKRMVNRTCAAVTGAQALGIPVVVTEQYPRGLGPTLKVVKDLLPNFAPVEKVDFSAWLPQVREQLTGRSQVLVVGMEAHVCVFQTTRDLVQAGLTAFVAEDGIISRTDTDRQAGVRLCERAGAVLTTVEAALFDALGRAGSPEFKAVSNAVK
jgi:nicotinamidase-related amidase